MNKSLLLLIGVLASSIVIAAEPSQTEPDNRRQKMREKVDSAFAESDRNGDGQLSLGEWQEARNRKIVEQFHKLDSNNDGQLTRDEIRAGRGARHGQTR